MRNRLSHDLGVIVYFSGTARIFGLEHIVGESMSDDLEALKQICAHWTSTIERMRGELVRAEKLFSKALDDQRARIAFAEEQLRVSLEGVKHFRETSPLSEIMSTLSKPTHVELPVTMPDELRTIIAGEGSPSWKSKNLTVYILEQATKPLINREIVSEHDRLGLKVGPSPDEVMENEPGKHKSLASAEKRSFNLKWGLIRHAFSDRVIKLENNTYWLKDHPRGAAPSLPDRPE